MSTTTRRTFPPVVTSSTWEGAWSTLHDRAHARRGWTPGAVVAPAVTCGDAVQLVEAWRVAGGAARWPLWYQYAAAAYGWEPELRDVLDVSARRRDMPYPPQLAAELWDATLRLAQQLDAAGVRSPRLAPDATWDDPTLLGAVRAQLVEDGARAQLVAPAAPPAAPRSADASSSWWSLALVVGALLMLLDDTTPRRSRSR